MKKKQSTRQTDHFTREAFKQGYPARSVFKLQEILKKYRFQLGGATILDVGAAPGSWTLLCAKEAGPKGRVYAVDLKKAGGLSAHPQWETLSRRIRYMQGDATDGTRMAALLEGARVDYLFSDAAPSTTGNRVVDTLASAGLFEAILELCPLYLKEGGSFVAKLFQGGEEQALRERMRGCFDKVSVSKPNASRDESFEIFLVGQGFRPEQWDAAEDVPNGGLGGW